MNPDIPLFQQTIVQECFQRVLFIWSIRHPASGYVQGINDLITPFFVVFLSYYICEWDQTPGASLYVAYRISDQGAKLLFCNLNKFLAQKLIVI